ncbi:MAG: autotransporter assembly complex protein TamA [Stellaceae bacterium]
MPRKIRHPLVVLSLAAFAFVLLGRLAMAANPQPYRVTIAATGNGTLDTALKGSSELEALHKKAPVEPFALVVRARQDVGRLKTVLESYGYYDGKVEITLDGRPISDSALPRILAAVPKGKPVEARIAIEKGPLFRVGHIRLAGPVSAAARAKLDLRSGAPAVASAILAARARLVAALQEQGHPFAKVRLLPATLEERTKTLDIVFEATPGPIAHIGSIRFTGLKSVNEGFARRHLSIHEGELYRPGTVEKARLALAALGVFSGVVVRHADHLGPDGRLPITFVVTERPKHAVGITAAYSTDLGASLTLTWSDRNLFGNAEQLNLSASGSGLAGDAVNGLGYDVSAQFMKPDFLILHQTLEFDLAALKQDLDAYNQQGFTGGLSLHRKLSSRWSAGIGLSGEVETILQEHVTRRYTLVGLPLSLKFDSTGQINPLHGATHGVRAALTAVPTESLGGGSASFAILQASGSAYYDLAHLGISAPGRSIIAVRGLAGSVDGASQFQLPPDQRFYGGGSPTIRGFRYQSVGPRFADGQPEGGTAIDAGTIEFRQRILDHWGMAAFVDAGQVSANAVPFTGRLAIGAGLGVRYYTPIGPVRLDAAVPLDPRHGDDAFELYIGLGQAF